MDKLTRQMDSPKKTIQPEKNHSPTLSGSDGIMKIFNLTTAIHLISRRHDA